MQALTFWKAVTVDRLNMLERVVEILTATRDPLLSHRRLGGKCLCRAGGEPGPGYCCGDGPARRDYFGFFEGVLYRTVRAQRERLSRTVMKKRLFEFISRGQSSVPKSRRYWETKR